jgi:hypothetical protein
MLGLWTDQRIGGHPQTVHGDSRDLMQLPERVKKLVCFIHTAGGGVEDLGTGFFVYDPVDANDAKGIPQNTIYVVTARHNVQRDPDEGPPIESIKLRLNTKDGRSDTIDTKPECWTHHDTADVSVYSFPAEGRPSEAVYDYLYYPLRAWPGPFYADEEGAKHEPEPFMAPGDEVFMTGLLVHHPGVTRIMPIIRVGNIAAIPEDPINLSTGPDRVILMESRSISGLSGSPVFVQFPPSRYDEDWNVEHLAPPVVPGAAGPMYLIGLNHGVFESEGNDIDGIGDASEGEPLNVGISIVVPIGRARELIDGPKLKGERDKARAALLAAGAPVKHRATRSAPANPEFDNFEDLARKLVQTPKPE